MQSIRGAVNLFSILKEGCFSTISSSLHTSSALSAWGKGVVPKKFLRFNSVVYPPQEPDEKPRPAFVCHQKTNIKYSPKKMWYVASFVRGMSVDEALKQLSFVNKKGALTVKEAILEAQEKAVKEHNVEFKSNLWVAESFSTKAGVIKGVRRHGKGRKGEVRYMYVHYFVRLEEGAPPASQFEYYGVPNPTPDQQLQEWLNKMRRRKVTSSL